MGLGAYPLGNYFKNNALRLNLEAFLKALFHTSTLQKILLKMSKEGNSNRTYRYKTVSYNYMTEWAKQCTNSALGSCLLICAATPFKWPAIFAAPSYACPWHFSNLIPQDSIASLIIDTKNQHPSYPQLQDQSSLKIHHSYHWPTL